MPAISPPIVRERARVHFFALLRTRHWSESDLESNDVDPDGLESASEVVEELALGPLALYRQIRDDLLEVRKTASRDHLVGFEGVPTYVKLALAGKPIRDEDKRIAQLHELMIQCVDRWHIRTDWCLQNGFQTLEIWRDSPTLLNRFEWFAPVHAVFPSSVSFKISDWDGKEPPMGRGSTRAPEPRVHPPNLRKRSTCDVIAVRPSRFRCVRDDQGGAR